MAVDVKVPRFSVPSADVVQPDDPCHVALIKQIETLRIADANRVYDAVHPLLDFVPELAMVVSEYYSVKGQATPSGSVVLQKYVAAARSGDHEDTGLCDDPAHAQWAISTRCSFPSFEEYNNHRDYSVGYAPSADKVRRYVVYGKRPDETCHAKETRCLPRTADFALEAAEITITCSYLEFRFHDLHDPYNHAKDPFRRDVTVSLSIQRVYGECYESGSAESLSLDMWLLSDPDRFASCRERGLEAHQFSRSASAWSDAVTKGGLTAAEFRAEEAAHHDNVQTTHGAQVAAATREGYFIFPTFSVVGQKRKRDDQPHNEPKQPSP